MVTVVVTVETLATVPATGMAMVLSLKLPTHRRTPATRKKTAGARGPHSKAPRMAAMPQFPRHPQLKNPVAAFNGFAFRYSDLVLFYSNLNGSILDVTYTFYMG